jgi:galactokinase
MKTELTQQNSILQAFMERFGAEPVHILRAPGRVNLIGEHTDYNDGFVLPMAIDRAIWIAFRPRTDEHICLFSLDFEEQLDIHLPVQDHEKGWGEYVRGTAWALAQHGYELQGWEGVIAGNIPIGAGLSSSAALELITAYTLSLSSGFAWEPMKMAKIAQYAENNWVGVQSGIMDQAVIAGARKGHAALIDCRTLSLNHVPLPPETLVSILDTTTRRGLVDSAYNERRQQCNKAAHQLQVPALRDVDLASFIQQESKLDPLIRRRARHVITENARVQASVQAMRDNNPTEFGRLMNESHASLRDDYEVSSAELDLIVELSQAENGCYGARMTGAGFGGCAVALVDRSTAQTFASHVSEKYHNRSDRKPEVYITAPTAGVDFVT